MIYLLMKLHFGFNEEWKELKNF